MEANSTDEKVLNYYYNLAVNSLEAEEIMSKLSSEELDKLVEKIENTNKENDNNENGMHM